MEEWEFEGREKRKGEEILKMVRPVFGTNKRYFEYAGFIKPCSWLKDNFDKYLRENIKQKCEKHGSIPSGVKYLMEHCWDCILDTILESREIAENSQNELQESSKRLFQVYDDLCDWERELKKREEEVLKRENAVKAWETITDENMLNAVRLFKQLTEPYEDEEKLRAITSAGAIVSASLGMKSYFGNLDRNKKQEDEK